MTEITKQSKPTEKPKTDATQKNQPALTEKQLDQVAGGTISNICATGKHFPGVKLTP